jgi:citrate lyase alpha subunit
MENLLKNLFNGSRPGDENRVLLIDQELIVAPERQQLKEHYTSKGIGLSLISVNKVGGERLNIPQKWTYWNTKPSAVLEMLLGYLESKFPS